MNDHGHKFFSISSDHIPTKQALLFDIYINSSAQIKEHFIKYYSIGEILTDHEIKLLNEKFKTIYLSETHRNVYLLGMHFNDNLTLIQKGDVVKSYAIKYLDDIFNHKSESNEYLKESLDNCKTATESMVKLIKDYGFSDVQKLIGDLSFHDFYTYDHSVNVAMYNILQYKSLKKDATEDELIIAGLSGMLHDIGKIKLSTDLINKSDELTEEDFIEIKAHPQYGKDVLSEHCACNGEHNIDLTEILKVIYEHHENYNGTGYPNQLSGTNISLLARITAVSDFYDAITTKRSYHDALPTEQALLLMHKSVGKKLDPMLFYNFVNQITKAINLYVPFNTELPDSFDPCQPHKKLGLIHKPTPVIIKDIIEPIGEVIYIDQPKKLKKSS